MEEHELLDRVDVKEWYEGEGERVITAMIDNLNTQGHRTLLIRENGEVYVELDAGNNQKVECIQNFPPRMVWEEICQTLKEDEISILVPKESVYPDTTQQAVHEKRRSTRRRCVRCWHMPNWYLPANRVPMLRIWER